MSPNSDPVSSRTVKISSCAFVILVLAVMAWQRWKSPFLDCVLNYDECYSTEYYTWAGVDRNGEVVKLRTLEDIRRLPPPSPQQLGMGVYRSLGVWKNTNNHIVNSFLVNIAMIGGSPTERIIRIPSFVGAIGFAVALYVLLQFTLGWRYAAPWIAMWAFAFPYVAHYGMEARGYAWMLFLQVLFLIAACQSVIRPRSIFWGATQVLLAVLSIMNIVSLSIHWILPVYLVFWLWPPGLNDSSKTPEHKRQVRRNMAVQLLAIGAVGFVFLMPRLPYVIRFSSQAGISFAGIGDFAAHLHGYVAYLFPDVTWVVLGCLGGVGAAASCRSKEYRCWGLAFFAAIAVTLAHFWVTKTVIYTRTMGFQLPLLFVGASYLIEHISRRINGIPKAAFLTSIAGLTAIVVWQSPTMEIAAGDPRTTFQEVNHRLANNNPPRVFAVVASEGYYMPKCLPKEWLTYLDDVNETHSVKKVLFLASRYSSDQNKHFLDMRHGEKAKAIQQPLKGQCLTVASQAGNCRTIYIDVHSEPFRSVGEYPGGAASYFLWYPDPMRVGTIGTPVIEMLGRAGVPYITRNRRFPAHLDFYTQLYAVEFVATSNAEWTAIKNTIESGIQRFGGHAVCFVAEK